MDVKALTPYQPNAVAEFGKNFMLSLIAQAAAEEEAQKLAAQAGEAKQFLGFEMIRAVFDLSIKNKDLDVYAIFGSAKDVEALNRRILVDMGVMKREISENDTVVYEFLDDGIKSLYSYTKELKEKDEAEYNRRFNNRKRLNMRLSEACKAVTALKDSGTKPEDLFYKEDETGTPVPTIRNAPKALAGEAGEIQLNKRTPVTGATMSPTVGSLVKLATEKHKAPAKERADKGEDRKGEAQMGVSAEDFGAAVNTVIRILKAQEGKFTKEHLKFIASLKKEVDKAAATPAK